MTFTFDTSWTRDLDGLFVAQDPDHAPDPRLVMLNEPLARELSLDLEVLQHYGAAWFSGQALPVGAEPVALAYAGHQFGGFSPSLGDGRAHLLGEFITPNGARFDLQLKGSGRTSFSRGGDGKAVLGPMLREVLISEAMAALGVPTTRALAVTTTGEQILRAKGYEPGAVLARVAQSHLRFGSFQYVAARWGRDRIQTLADYAIARHDPDLMALPESQRYLAFFKAVCQRQAQLIAQWMAIGFVHGVMNTDNMTISGETIDYGPCAFIDRFSPGAVFSSIDQQGRYAWGNQPLILTWNLARLAETLLPLLHQDPDQAVELAQEALSQVAGLYQTAWHQVMGRKLGLSPDGDHAVLIADFVRLMAGADWTWVLYHLRQAISGDPAPLAAYLTNYDEFLDWLPRWRASLAPDAEAQMAAHNPAVIARNHHVEAALSAATAGDMGPFFALLSALRQPFEDHPIYGLPPTDQAPRYVTYCGT